MTKILIIDDDLEVVDNLSVLLKGVGYNVSSRDNIEGATQEIIKDKPDLIILDIMFPENPAGGFELAREIRQTEGLKQIPIILLTSINQEFPMDFSSKDIDQDWIPVEAFLEKPIKLSKLLEKIKQLLK